MTTSCSIEAGETMTAHLEEWDYSTLVRLLDLIEGRVARRA